MLEAGGDAEVTFYHKQQVTQGRLSCKYCSQTMDDHRMFERHTLLHSDSRLWRRKNKNDEDENTIPWFALRGADEEEPEVSTDPIIFTDPIAMDSIARQLAGISFLTRFHRCSRASSGVCTDRSFCITSANQANINSEQCRWLCQQCGYAISRLPLEVVVLLALAHMFKKHAVEERDNLLEQWNSFNRSFGVGFKLDNDPTQPVLIFDDFLPPHKEARFLEDCLQQGAYQRKRFLLCTKCMELHETATQFVSHLAGEHGVRECQQFFTVPEERTVSGDLFPLTPQWFPLAVVTSATPSFSWQCFGCDEKVKAQCFVGLVVKTALHVTIHHADDLRFLSSLRRLSNLLRSTDFDGIRKKLAAARPLVSTESDCLKQPSGNFTCEFCQETFPRLVASGTSDQCAHIILRHQPILDCPGALRYLFAQRTAVESEPPYLKVSCSGYVNGSAGNKVFCAKCSYQASSFEQLLRHADDRHSDAPKV
ncbi:hypothetical protein AAVH_04934 [Aphelenchoides avenae]|nr:hypothetical protein AAVH_04934 [Aphelenchus avenae]